MCGLVLHKIQCVVYDDVTDAHGLEWRNNDDNIHRVVGITP